MMNFLPINKYMSAIAAFSVVLFFVLYSYELEVFRFFRSHFDVDSQRTIEYTQTVLVYLFIYSIIQSYRKTFRVPLLEKMVVFLFGLLKRWVATFVNSLTKDNGYLVVFSILGIYVTVYSLVESKAARDSTNLTTKHSNFVSLVSAGNNLSFKYAMSLVPQLHSQKVIIEPDFFSPSTWLKTENYSMRYELYNWMDSYLSSCTFDICGQGAYRIDMSGLDLGGIRFSGVNFTESNLSNVELDENRIRGSDFSGSNLDGIEITDSTIQPSNFGENYGGDPSLFMSAKIRGARIQHSDLSGSDFDNADFSPLHSGTGGQTTIDNSVLRYCSFKNANLSKVKFIRTDIRNTDFTGSHLAGATFNSVVYDETTKFPNEFDMRRLND